MEYCCVPQGHFENSPAFERRGLTALQTSPAGTAENGACRVAALAKTDFVPAVPVGLVGNYRQTPAFKRRAIFKISLRDKVPSNLDALIESNRHAISNLMQLTAISRLVCFRSPIQTEAHRFVKTFRITVRGQDPKCNRLVILSASCRQSTIAKRPANSLPPVLRKNVNCHDLSNRSRISILVP